MWMTSGHAVVIGQSHCHRQLSVVSRRKGAHEHSRTRCQILSKLPELIRAGDDLHTHRQIIIRDCANDSVTVRRDQIQDADHCRVVINTGGNPIVEVERNDAARRKLRA